jgi:hypothetical protein
MKTGSPDPVPAQIEVAGEGGGDGRRRRCEGGRKEGLLGFGIWYPYVLAAVVLSFVSLWPCLDTEVSQNQFPVS